MQLVGTSRSPTPSSPLLLSPLPKSHPADVLILATRFTATEFLQPLTVVGRTGQELHDVCAERRGPQTYMTTSVDGFPNFFMVMGPNPFVGHTSVIMSIENCANYIIRVIEPVLAGDAPSIEPKPETV